MSQQSEQDLKEFMDKIYINLYNILAPQIGKEDAPSYMMSMFTTGITLDESFEVSEYANQIPQVSKNYVDSGRKVQDVYSIILGADCPQDDQEKAMMEKEKYDRALGILYKDGDINQESDLYKAYQEKQGLYDDAVNEYYAEYNKPKSEQDKAKLRALEMKMDRAFKDFASHGKAQVENAINVMATYDTYSTSSIFKKAGADFQSVYEYDVETIPAEWTDTDSLDNLAWKKVEIQYSHESSKTYKSIKNTKSDMSNNFKNGFWVFYSSKGSSESQDMSMSSEANSSSDLENVTITMEVANIKLYRSWLNLSLLGFSDVTLKAQKAGFITNGSLVDTDNCEMPIMPDSLIIARNINVYGDFSKEERSFVEEASSHSESAVTYGPFSISSDEYHFYDSSDVKDEEWSRFATPFKLSFSEKPQIIGVLSSVLKPCFPRKDG